MQAAFKENDTVYTPYGYGVLVNAGKKSGENVNSEEVGKSEGNENGVKTTNGEEKCSCKEENGHTSNGVCSMHKKQSSSQDQQVNLVTVKMRWGGICLLYTSDAADDLLCVDLGGRRIIKKKNNNYSVLCCP
eukprot:TRINITY_DN5377_c0_g1_i12.p1 TRINITY_DN5377_c0_g1~~TRINITY_DN5377_c0_g1_i12.p1  ORF type:complete len:132 (+),score=29.96 TRINITY_DN5377_c0_g1_i12:204-599(+)